MFKLFGGKTEVESGPSDGYAQALQAIDSLYQQELQANMAALAEQRRRTRVHRSTVAWVEYWPLAIGVAISCFVPQLHDIAESLHPWGMWLLFPFAALSGRPEVINPSNNAAAYMPLTFMYVQYPLEGLLARFGLRGHVTVPRVLGQVLFLHLFAVTELWRRGAGTGPARAREAP